MKRHSSFCLSVRLSGALCSAGQHFADAAGQNIVFKLGVILVAFDAEEDKAERQRGGDKAGGQPKPVDDDVMVSQHHGEAAANQHEGIEGANPFDEMDLMRLRPMELRPGRRTIAQDDVDADEGGEEHDFRNEEYPHGEFAVGQRQTHVVQVPVIRERSVPWQMVRSL